MSPFPYPIQRGILLTREFSRRKAVEFFVTAPDAGEVFLAGEFNRWDLRSLPMEETEDGRWTVSIDLPPGRHEFKVLADASWLEAMPCCVMAEGETFGLVLETQTVPNPFGTRNFVIEVR
jgi:hypothetical protein